MTRDALVGWLLVLALSVALGSYLWMMLPSDRVSLVLAGERYDVLAPPMLALSAVIPLLLWSVRRSLADLPLLQRIAGTLVRVALVSCVVLALARIAERTESHRISTVVLVDVSDSMTDADLRAARQRVAELWQQRGSHDVQLVTFAARARARALGDPPDLDTAITRPAGDEARGSNLQAALQLAYGLFPPGHLRKVLVLSDGRQTHGSLAAEASTALEHDVEISFDPGKAGVPAEVAVHDLAVPENIKVGEPFRVRTEIFSTVATQARVRLYQGRTLNGLDGVRDVELTRGANELTFESVVRVAGDVTYRLEVDPSTEDRFSQNNTFSLTAHVAGRPRVLYVEGQPKHARYLANALAAGEYDVDVRNPSAIPVHPSELDQFDFFILSDVNASHVSLQQMKTIEGYVRDGGGFLMAGGDDSFGLGGYQGTRLERMLPVRMDSERRRDEHTLALSLVIDRSGSMAGQKIELAKDAAKATAEILGPDDYISVVGFSGQPERLVRMQSARNRVKILNDIGRLAARGGTAIFPALDMAFQDLAVTRARIKHVILLTDGQTQEAGIPELVQAMRAEGITVSTIGLGGDVNRSLLQGVANQGGGRAYFTNDPKHIPRIFTRETTTVARNSAVEEFVRVRPTEPADFLRGMDVGRAPYLHGYVSTQPKPRPAQVVLESDLGEPILARWRVGLGWALAWTSDVKNRWAVEWLRWPRFSQFWSQLVREHMRQRRLHELDMRAEVVDSQARVVVDAIGPDDAFLNDLDSRLTVRGPLGAERGQRGSATHELLQTAPGRYEARFALHDFGSYVLAAEHRREGRLVAESSARISHPYPREYAQLDRDVSLLEHIAQLSGGEMAPSASAIFDAKGRGVRHHRELWPLWVLLALGLFVVDLILRRVRIFSRSLSRASPA